MKIKTQLPDLAASFARLNTMIDLETHVDENTILGHAVKLAFIQKQPNTDIIQMIKDQILDNRKAVENCIPEYIIRSIEKYFPEIEADADDLKDLFN